MQVQMFIQNRLIHHVSGIIMSIVRRTDCIKPHTVRSARVPTPHNNSQHIQANTTRGFIQSVLLTMDIMMPETCRVNLLKINIYTRTCVICWFFLLLDFGFFNRKGVGTNQVMLLMSDNKNKNSNSQLCKAQSSLGNSELDGK